MATKKEGQENIRKITRTGKTSLAVTLPIGLVRELGWREKQKVVIKKTHGGLVIRDWRK